MVIQRWQNLMLLIAAAMMGIFSFCSLGQFQGADVTVNFTASGMAVEGTGASYMGTFYLFVVALLGAILPLLAIFKYKALGVQRRIILLSIVLIIAAMATAFLSSLYAGVPGADGIGWSSVVIAPFIALAALVIALRCIASDKRKLASYDRLR